VAFPLNLVEVAPYFWRCNVMKKSPKKVFFAVFRKYQRTGNLKKSYIRNNDFSNFNNLKTLRFTF